MSTAKCFSYENSEDLDLNHEEIIKALDTVEKKIYVEPEAILITSEGIFLNLEGELFAISNIFADGEGIYTFDCYWEPCFSDDWQCDRGHWSPCYENKCVSCGRPKRANSPRWRDRRR